MADTAAAKKSETSVKDTIESILVAFILAFIFRCFVVEAFVIPTGSMAPTLMGAHMDLRCAHCGWQFSVGFGTDSDTYSIPANASKTYSLICPNCGLQLPLEDARDPDNDARGPIVRYGDRILVMKYLYLFHEASRWDVVVFKSPDAPQEPGKPDAVKDYSVNYIKRLVGLPNESLFVAQGDLFVCPPGQDPEVAGNYRVRTKTPAAQEALWRIVFDADFIPLAAWTGDGAIDSKPTGWRMPWQPSAGSGWTNHALDKNVPPREFRFENPSGAGTLKFDSTSQPAKASLTDWLAYNQTIAQDAPGRGADTSRMESYGTSWEGVHVSDVSDLKLSAFVGSYRGPGPLRLVLGKGADEFAAEFTSESVRLLRRRGESSDELGKVPVRLTPGTKIAIQNVDYQVSVFVNGDRVLQTTPEQYAPDVQAVVNQIVATDRNDKYASPKGWAQIEAEQATLQLSHLQLWRDVYYRDQSTNPRGGPGIGPVGRATAYNFPKKVVRLGDEEYFVLGDNSYASSDARLWSSELDLSAEEDLKAQAGVVPGRFLLGKAFFVYWPSGYRPFSGAPSLVPNFGQMRFIR